jgi:NADP-dependent 3-hydroxy acid dehydrogenase YdfG
MKGKAVLVTGANSGIGFATAAALAARGAFLSASRLSKLGVIHFTYELARRLEGTAPVSDSQRIPS